MKKELVDTAYRPTINSDECAELLLCSVCQVEEMARAGEIPALKIGRSWIFIREDLIAYLADKARKEAIERSSMRSPNVTQLVAKPRRRSAPPLPQCA